MMKLAAEEVEWVILDDCKGQIGARMYSHLHKVTCAKTCLPSYQVEEEEELLVSLFFHRDERSNAHQLCFAIVAACLNHPTQVLSSHCPFICN